MTMQHQTYSGRKSLLSGDYLKAYNVHRKAHDVNRELLKDRDARSALGSIFYIQKGAKQMRECTGPDYPVIVPVDVVAESGMSMEAAIRSINRLSGEDVGVLRNDGSGAYVLTEVGKACMDDLVYRRNKLRLLNLSEMSPIGP